MKRFAYLFSLSTTAFILAFAIMTSCEGPAGPAGQAGADGTNGVDGDDGIDANETCKVCHNDESLMLAKQIQHGNAVHMTGGNFERSDKDCAACHTHEGFVDRMTS
ncbi:MAG: collagen-like protein, partial [Bacteroidales bacterium]|nr:collagen-like protein [Bacteroidales bacterium]